MNYDFEKRHEKEDSIKFGVLVVAILLLIVFLVIGVLSVRPDFDKISYCSEDSKIPRTAVLLDLTEVRSENQIAEMTSLVRKVISLKSLHEHESFEFFMLPGESGSPTKKILSDDQFHGRYCRPPRDRGFLDEFNESKKTVESWRRWERDFLQKNIFKQLEDEIRKSMQNSKISAIFESIESISNQLTSDDSMLRLVIISDFLQNSRDFSMYPNIPEVGVFLSTEIGNAFLTRLRKALLNVDLILCQLSPPPQMIISYNSAEKFWKGFLSQIKYTNKVDDRFQCIGFDTKDRLTRKELKMEDSE